jgi:hypothetical protein
MQAYRMTGHSNEARFPRTINVKSSTLNESKAQETMLLSPRELLEKELESVVRDIDAIEYQIAGAAWPLNRSRSKRELSFVDTSSSSIPAIVMAADSKFLKPSMVWFWI